MIISQQTERTTYPTGEVMHECTRAVVTPLFDRMYDSRTHPDGYQWIYVGAATKWNKKGDVIWQLKYDDFGRVIASTTNPENNNQH